MTPAPTDIAGVSLREALLAGDVARIEEIVRSTGFFTEAEAAVASELAQDRATRGATSDYRFLLAETEGRVVGYTCYGEIACTVGSFDLYWIVVDQSHRGRGLGPLLLAETERRIAALGGRAVYAETSSRPQYEPTRRFYLRQGFTEAARLADFYAPGDAKVVYAKQIHAHNEA